MILKAVKSPEQFLTLLSEVQAAQDGLLIN